MTRTALLPHQALRQPPVEWTLVDLFTVFVRRRRLDPGLPRPLLWCRHSLLDMCHAALPCHRRHRNPKDSRGAFGLDNTTADRPSTEVSDSFDDNLTLQTEVGILQSDALTLGVIRVSSSNPRPTTSRHAPRPPLPSTTSSFCADHWSRFQGLSPKRRIAALPR